jgi:hypothetical protein
MISKYASNKSANRTENEENELDLDEIESSEIENQNRANDDHYQIKGRIYNNLQRKRIIKTFTNSQKKQQLNNHGKILK